MYTHLPPAKKASERFRRGFAGLAANPEKIKELQENAEKSKFFDGGARQRREAARTLFECFVQEVYGFDKPEDIWNKDRFVSLTKQFIQGIALTAKGKFGDKIKAATLWGYKHAIYWWACALVKDFHLIWQSWHEEVSRHIHMIAVHESLSTQSWKKVNLSDVELVIIFKFIMEQQHGVANYKQHWAAMLLVWLTAARPGTIVVGEGYQKGASLGRPDKTRPVDETLRWSDVDFIHMMGGIAVRITFRYNKGYRNPHQEGAPVSANVSRTFLFLPSRGERLEFDLPIILFGIAYERGRFRRTIEEILGTPPSEVFLEKVPDVNSQAVFVASNQAGTLDPSQPMRLAALNPKLKQICASIGLLERNTYYSLRRTAIIEVRRRHGTEAAKDLAFHKPSANSLFFYDNVGFGDVDMQQMRLGGPEGMSREEVRKFFSQANVSRYTGEESLTHSIDAEVKKRLPQQPEYINGELELKSLYEEISSALSELQQSGDIPDNEKIPTGYSTYRAAELKSLLSKYNQLKLFETLQDKLALRKQLLRKLRLQLRNDIRTEKREKHKAVLNESMTASKRVLAPGGGYQPERVRGLRVPGIGESAEQALLDSEEDDGDADEDEDEDDGVDEDVLGDHDYGSREEPECWEGLGKVVTMQMGGKDGGSQAPLSAEESKIRREFLLKWIGKGDSVVPQSKLHCPRCQTDPTIDQTTKEREFNRFRLNTHMRGETHTREQQLRPALKADGVTEKTLIDCPCCKEPVKGVKKFLRHLHDFHPQEIWDDMDEEEDASDETDFEGFSDPVGGDDEEEEDEVDVPFQGVSPLRPGKKRRVLSDEEEDLHQHRQMTQRYRTRGSKGKQAAETLNDKQIDTGDDRRRLLFMLSGKMHTASASVAPPSEAPSPPDDEVPGDLVSVNHQYAHKRVDLSMPMWLVSLENEAASGHPGERNDTRETVPRLFPLAIRSSRRTNGEHKGVQRSASLAQLARQSPGLDLHVR
ncbi:hypothetical protein P154DRAFT_574468 [Amniculicola lignicola CBS 123094]|uniref:Uncharacterized protein n=1 Tax=Amniculicola lignicola CBS 123094 TaxID=1392246 RepID=A0A6A5WWZ2_9PLEO|nr:hypothetical protein P154DRAFT_574468 [Amniculicola lignicola CBS 123094]